MQRVGADRHDRPLGDRVTPDHVIPQRLAIHDPRGWAQPHRLLQRPARIGQPLQRLQRRHAIAQHLVDLTLHPARRLRVTREQIDGPAQRHRSGLVPCQHQRHHLVAQLLIGHAIRAGVIRRGHQHAQQIPRGRVAVAALLDDGVDQPIEGRPRSQEAAVGRRGHPQRQRGQRR